MNRVAVLMSTYNGNEFIHEQIESIENQVDVEIELFIRDDGSSESMRTLLRQLMNKYSNIHIFFGENKGYMMSFSHLIKSVPDNYGWYAFADQDDIWDPYKLLTLISKNTNEDGRPTLLYSNATVFSESGALGKLYSSEHSFVSFIDCLYRPLYGMSFLLNQPLFAILRETESRAFELFAHDGWTAMVAAYCGSIQFVNMPLVSYRQHANNVSGLKTEHKKSGLRHLIKRMIDLPSETRKWRGRVASAAELLNRLNFDRSDEIQFNIIQRVLKQRQFSNRIRLIVDRKFSAHSVLPNVVLRVLAVRGEL